MADTAAALRAEFESAKVERRDHIRWCASRLRSLAADNRPPELYVWAAKWRGATADRFNSGFVPSYRTLESEIDEAQGIGTGYLHYINSNL